MADPLLGRSSPVQIEQAEDDPKHADEDEPNTNSLCVPCGVGAVQPFTTGGAAVRTPESCRDRPRVPEDKNASDQEDDAEDESRPEHGHKPRLRLLIASS